MSFFLDQRDHGIRGRLIECRFDPDCYSHNHVRKLLSGSNSLCNLNQRQQSLAGKPLSRRVYRGENRPHLGGEKRYIQRALNRKADQLQLTLTRVSSIIDRLLETGIVCDARLESTKNDVERVKSGRLNEVFRFKRLLLVSRKRSKFVEFDSADADFDMRALIKIQPIFNVCLVCLALVFCYETKFRFLADFSRSFVELMIRIWKAMQRRGERFRRNRKTPVSKLSWLISL